MTKTPQHNVPELRFPEFEGEWEEKKLGDIASFSKGKSLSKKDISENGVACILYGELYTKYNAFIDEIYSKTSVDKSTLVQGKENQILIPSSGETSEDIATASCLVSNKVVYIGGDINIITPKKDKGRFISLSLNSVNKNEIAKFAQGKSVVHLYNDHLKKTKIKIPNNLNEQEKIGTFFSKLDRQIELEEQKLAKLEEQKKGYMQQIFSQELRFKDENGNDYPTWKKTTIKEVAKLTVGKSKKNENTGKYIIMDMGTVTKNGTMLTHKSTPHENGLLNKGDLVMPKDDIGGGHIIGKTVFIPESQKYVLGDHVYRLETKKCNGLFLHFYINSDIVNRSLKRKVTGSAQLGLNRKSVEEELVKVPCLEEQEKIGAFFSKLDTFIEKQLSKIELLKERKKGFLQKMFV
ncbi:restriction endonuclease subunit S [Staphylococcus chromogenes]|uniref:restriction endonuclease subunit S n=1 Tax=Staphylococcus chromogenes TaxID=46126 RepID=UPI001E5F5D60|nr:restriction endonuclease subunit S [Staphylococcus chromogenes]MCD9059921.1 restriction endonuclease subunit S [Staphylococcus chromogenes]